MSNILAIKNSKKIEYLKFCVECGQLFTSVRNETLTCSNRCKQRVTRKKKANKPFLVQNRGITPEELKKFKFDKGNVTVIK